MNWRDTHKDGYDLLLLLRPKCLKNPRNSFYCIYFIKRMKDYNSLDLSKMKKQKNSYLTP